MEVNRNMNQPGSTQCRQTDKQTGWEISDRVVHSVYSELNGIVVYASNPCILFGQSLAQVSSLAI
jgi:uncharacterized membrane protein